MNKQLEKELQRMGAELALKIGKVIYRKLKDKKKGRKVIAKVGPRKYKKK